MSKPYLTSPLPTERMPTGTPYIVMNEAAERFSFYGMRGILVVFMTKHLLDTAGSPAFMEKPEAVAHYHFFVSAVYAFPILGAILSDWLLGKYRTIISLSIVYCLGHLALALDETRVGLAVGLGLIALGSGGIKPCVSAHLGDQFGVKNQALIEKVFSWFYFSINFGAFFSTLLTPVLLEVYGPHVAFGLPGLLMLLATWVFWLGRYEFVHIPPGGWSFVRETFGPTGLWTVLRLTPIYACLIVFWSLYDQTGSAWVLQADKMDRTFSLFGRTVEILPSQVHAANPALIMLFIPLFSFVIYPAIERVFPLTPLRKMGLGLMLTSLSFMLIAWFEQQLLAGVKLHVVWQLIAYIIITAAEVMVSITSLEFSYKQAPPRMKSLLMAANNLTVSLGNSLAGTVNHLIDPEHPVEWLAGANYYRFFAGIMLVAAIAFVGIAMAYRPRTYLQGTPQPLPTE